MNGDERQNEPRRTPEFHQYAGQERGDHQVVGGRREPHAEDDAEDGGQPQQDVDVAAGDRFDHAHHGIVETCR